MHEFRDVAALEAALEDVGQLLHERRASVEICVIGGAAFLMQEPTRQFATADVDVAARIDDGGSPTIEDVIPHELARAANEVADIHGLSRGWINGAVVASFGMLLPDGFIERATRKEHGGLRMLVASREDLLYLKMLAAVQRGGAAGAKHMADVKRAAPTVQEVEAIAIRIERSLSDPAAFRDRIDRIVKELMDG